MNFKKIVRHQHALILAIIVALLTLSAWKIVDNDADDFLENHAVFTMREIGHNILLQAGDSITPLPPVKQPAERVFRIQFPHELHFVSDSLVKIAQRAIDRHDVNLNYSVSVIGCDIPNLLYGFDINTSSSKNIVACLGRVQPHGCYYIDVKFGENKPVVPPVFLYLTAMGLFVAGLMLIRRSRNEPNHTDNITSVITEASADTIRLNTLEFVPSKSIIIALTGTLELSEKETKVLKCLCSKINEVVPRDQILHDVWEAEGVFTGRSLDVFISRLRKKLAHDQGVQIVNVHGKGYRLEVNKITT